MMTRRDIANHGCRVRHGGLPGLAGAATAPTRSRPKAAPFPAKAKRVIYLFLNGGPSQVDTFDPKPMLDKYHGKPMPSGQSADRAQDRQPVEVAVHVQEIRTERHRGQRDLSQAWRVHRRPVRDPVDVSPTVPNHEPSLFMLNCGEKLPGRPSMGSWVTYGLGHGESESAGFRRAMSRSAGGRATSCGVRPFCRRSTRERTSTPRRRIPTG